MDIDNVEIPKIWELETEATETTETINRVYWLLVDHSKKSRCLFYPLKDVYILPRIDRAFNIAYFKQMFDSSINLETELQKYVNGFKTGYVNFEKEVKDFPLLFGETVFSAIKYLPLLNSTYPHQTQNGKIIPYKWFELGKTLGRYYCAWCIVLKNQSYFEPLFKDYFKTPAININNGFKTNLNRTQLKSLFDQLIKDGFISPDNIEYNFLHVFGEPLPDGKGFEPVKWIKKGKNKETNKASLINLFQLLKIDINNDFYKCVYHYFGTDKEHNIKLKTNNKSNSQYYSSLQKIVESL